MLENVEFYPGTRDVNFHDTSITENTRVSYPLEYIPGAKNPAVGGHPKNIFFLTCDAYGVLPPVSLLTPEQAMYHFISGYTAKVREAFILGSGNGDGSERAPSHIFGMLR